METLLWVGLAVGLSSDPIALDRARITDHLAQTEADLRAREAGHLSEALREARAENLDALHRYWVRAVYPRNTNVPGTRVPVFIDDAGRACAVGQLMIDSGAQRLAQRIAMDERLEFLATIDTEGVGEWAAASGLTLSELSRIQPTYCNCDDEPLEPVCGEDGWTYPNVCMAVDCAGVAVAHEGPCEGNSESGNGVTDGATTGEGDGSSSGGSTSTTTSTSTGEAGASSSSTTAASSTGDASPSSGAEPSTQGDSAGCRTGGASVWGLFSLLLLGWRRR